MGFLPLFFLLGRFFTSDLIISVLELITFTWSAAITQQPIYNTKNLMLRKPLKTKN